MPGPNRDEVDSEVMQAVQKIAERLMGEGARAVLLLGSHVRGDAYGESDIDIVALGEGPFYQLERHGEHLVSVSWRTPKVLRETFAKVPEVGGAIPGFRAAVVVRDPEGIATSLKAEASRWSWDVVGDRCDAWVAEELSGFAEEVHKLVGNLEMGRRSAAAIQRSVLALRLAGILAVHNRLLYDTENQLWDVVSGAMGERWSRAQSKALGLGGESFEDTCAAALELFALAAKELSHLFDERQHEVVAHACDLAGHPLD